MSFNYFSVPFTSFWVDLNILYVGGWELAVTVGTEVLLDALSSLLIRDSNTTHFVESVDTAKVAT